MDLYIAVAENSSFLSLAVFKLALSASSSIINALILPRSPLNFVNSLVMLLICPACLFVIRIRGAPGIAPILFILRAYEGITSFHSLGLST